MKSFCQRTVRCDPLWLQCASAALKADKEVMLCGVTFSTDSIRYDPGQGSFQYISVMSPHMQRRTPGKKAKEARKPRAAQCLQFASKDMRADRDFVCQAIDVSDPSAFQHASNALTDDNEFVMTTLSAVCGRSPALVGHILRHASERLKSDKDVVLKSVSYSGQSLEYAGKDLQADKDLVMCALAANGCCLQHVSEDLKADKDVILRAAISTVLQ